MSEEPLKIMSAPMSVELGITGNCNLRCKYCSHFSSSGEVDDDLSTSEWLQFFDELGRIGVFYMCIQGGEPFVRKDLKQLIEGIVKNRMRFNILSNGTLITDEMAAFLDSTGRCDSVQVSIDGSTSSVHDSFRGKGNFEKAIRGIEHLRNNDVPVDVRVTIHRQNVADLEKVAKLLLEDIGLPSFSTNSASHMGLCRKNADMVQLTHQERTLAMETLLELNDKYEDRISADAGPLADGRTWLRMEQARVDGLKSLPGCGYMVGCNGPKEKVGVRADGVIVPCILMSHIELGHINKDDFQEVWKGHPELKRIRTRHKVPLGSFDFCRGCDYVNYCTGNCPALAYTILGEDHHPSPDACLRKFLDEGGQLPEKGL